MKKYFQGLMLRLFGLMGNNIGAWRRSKIGEIESNSHQQHRKIFSAHGCGPEHGIHATFCIDIAWCLPTKTWLPVAISSKSCEWIVDEICQFLGAQGAVGLLRTSRVPWGDPRGCPGEPWRGPREHQGTPWSAREPLGA